MNDKLQALAEWLTSLDDDDPESPGRQDRRTVTLTQIIDRARAALPAPDPTPAEAAEIERFGIFDREQRMARIADAINQETHRALGRAWGQQ